MSAWSDADRELVAGALGNVMLWVRTNATWRSPERAAEMVLDALAAAGKLLPERDDGATYDELARWWDATADHRAALIDWRPDAG